MPPGRFRRERERAVRVASLVFGGGEVRFPTRELTSQYVLTRSFSKSQFLQELINCFHISKSKDKLTDFSGN